MDQVQRVIRPCPSAKKCVCRTLTWIRATLLLQLHAPRHRRIDMRDSAERLRGLLVSTALLMSAAAVGAENPAGPDDTAAVKPIVDARLRYEGVDQEGFANEAEAVTMRARLGFERRKAWETSLLAEGEFVWPLVDRYDSTVNGNTTYPVVADPESYEFNRLQLTNTSLPMTTMTLGRQRIILDDHRFVGNVGWRQNEQTFDSLRLVNKSIENLTIDVAYVDQVNRVFGKESPEGRYEGDSILANVAYQWSIGKLTAYGYRLQFDPIAGVPAAAGDSSMTYGLRFAGERPARAV